MKNLIFILLAFYVPNVLGQFAPAAGEPGSTAIHKDDVLFTGWAKTCKVTRGFINISDTSLTFTQGLVTSNRAFFGTEDMATGKPGGPLDCVSLGDGGTALLTFDFPLRNGPGADFAVFENGIKEQEAPFQYFLELAFVEVSTDGKKFVRFPAVSNTPAQTQINGFGQLNPVDIYNLAGKYIANYGTPFDLSELTDSVGINLDSINFIRLIDVVGNIDLKHARYDGKGKIINDPFPTEFWTGGFDLDAVGAIHLNGLTGKRNKKLSAIKVYPNPVSTNSTFFIEGACNTQIELWSQTGKLLNKWAMDEEGVVSASLPELSKGLYILFLKTKDSNETIKLLVE